MKFLLSFFFCVAISLSFSQQIPVAYTGVWTTSADACKTFKIGILEDNVLTVHKDGLEMDMWWIQIESLEEKNGALIIKGKGKDAGLGIEKEITLKLREKHLFMDDVSYQKCNL